MLIVITFELPVASCLVNPTPLTRGIMLPEWPWLFGSHCDALFSVFFWHLRGDSISIKITVKYRRDHKFYGYLHQTLGITQGLFILATSIFFSKFSLLSSWFRSKSSSSLITIKKWVALLSVYHYLRKKMTKA